MSIACAILPLEIKKKATCLHRWPSAVDVRGVGCQEVSTRGAKVSYRYADRWRGGSSTADIGHGKSGVIALIDTDVMHIRFECHHGA